MENGKIHPKNEQKCNSKKRKKFCDHWRTLRRRIGKMIQIIAIDLKTSSVENNSLTLTDIHIQVSIIYLANTGVVNSDEVRTMFHLIRIKKYQEVVSVMI